MQTCDVAIIGAGIVGTACAYELASAGLRVIVVDPNAIASGSTNLAYGNLSILDDKPGQFELTRYGLALWNRLAEWLPQECEYRKIGTLWLASESAALEDAAHRAEFFNAEGVAAQPLDSRRVAAAEPGLRPDLAGGLLVTGDASFQPARAAQYLFQLAVKKGAQHLRRSALMLFEHEVRLDDNQTLYAGSIINAAGSEAPSLSPQLPIEFVKSHLLVVQANTTCARYQLCELTSHPAADDSRVRFQARQSLPGPNQLTEIWIGVSNQTANASSTSQVEPRVVASVLRRAIEMLPGVGRAQPQRSWTVLRATTSDGLPLIGRVPGIEGLFAATAHNDFSATTSLATARLIADEILLRTPEIDPTPYLPQRFRGTTS
jgi:glycine/D-amino acid oxidase-like deaminating enzyme